MSVTALHVSKHPPKTMTAAAHAVNALLFRLDQARAVAVCRDPFAFNPAFAPVGLNFIIARMLQYKGLAKIANQVTQGMRGMHDGE